MDGLRKAAFQSGVRVDEFVHLLRVTRHDADKLPSVVLESFQESVYGLRAKRVLVARLERISLVDEEHTADSGIHELVCLYGSLSTIS